MTDTASQLRKRRDAFRLTSDLMMDLVAGRSTYVVLRSLFARQADIPDHVQTAAARLCLFHAIVSLSKWVELYDRYKHVIPDEVRDQAKKLRAEVNGRGIVEFRNKVVGHVWDLDQQRALSNLETEERLQTITRSDVAAFLDWAGDPEPTAGGESAALVIERVRDSIRERYGLTDDDLHR
ncbi:MAG: hypothetical protein ABR998_10545 [Gemmatimonadales bacterium]|jgi:hypothetical protein